MNGLDILSAILGWSYFLCWSLSFYPQPLLNIRRKSVTGLSIEFPFINSLGFVAYSITTLAFFYSPLIRKQYAERHPTNTEPTVERNDVAFALHGLVLTIITYSQFWLWGFKFEPKQRRVQPWIAGVFCGSILMVIAFTIFVWNSPGAGYDTSGWAWIDLVYLISYVKLLITCVKYPPQVWKNYRQKSTVGWSIGQILLDLAGGILSLAQLVLDSLKNGGDWSGVTGNPVKFGLANVSMIFDTIFIAQHYFLYRDATKVDEATASSRSSSSHHGEEEEGGRRRAAREDDPLLARED